MRNGVMPAIAIGVVAVLAGLTWLVLAPAATTPPATDNSLAMNAEGDAPPEAARPRTSDRADHDGPPTRDASPPGPAEDADGPDRRSARADARPDAGPVEKRARVRVRKPSATTSGAPQGTEAIARAAQMLRSQARESSNPAEVEALLAAAEELERKLTPYVGALARDELDLRTALAVLGADAALKERFAEPNDSEILDGSKWTPDDGLPEHVVLQFPKGVHRFNPEDVSRLDPPPKTVVIEGAGMDSTALVGWARWNPPRNGPRWTFRDCTIHCNDEPFANGGRGEFRLERVRVVGYLDGSGGSTMMDQSGLLVAVDCRFEAGFAGRSGSRLFMGRDLFVRLEGCTFVGPFQDFSSATALVATDCAFEWTKKAFVKHLEKAVAAAAREAEGGASRRQPEWFYDCVIESVHEKGHWPERKLADINVDWAPDR